MERAPSRRPKISGGASRAARSEKVSVSIQGDDLAWLRRRAKAYGGNLSAVLAEGTRLLRQCESRGVLLTMLGDAAKMTPEEADAIRREWDGATPPRGRR
ncbi:MAG: hypothetical protein J0L92_23300 [Deltaproteobacteria bacterium]|nr:hypothetical protein [Deltaproteobacteria bacterium]